MSVPPVKSGACHLSPTVVFDLASVISVSEDGGSAIVISVAPLPTYDAKELPLAFIATIFT